MGGHARGRFGVVRISVFEISADMEARWHGSLSGTPPWAIMAARGDKPRRCVGHRAKWGKRGEGEMVVAEKKERGEGPDCVKELYLSLSLT